MRAPVAALLLALALPCAAAEDEESPLGLSYVRTPDVKLIYLDPTLTYLAPHALRTFTRSLAG